MNFEYFCPKVGESLMIWDYDVPDHFDEFRMYANFEPPIMEKNSIQSKCGGLFLD